MEKKVILSKPSLTIPRAIEINPIFTEAYYNRGNTYENKVILPKPSLTITKAIEINPNYTEGLL